MLTKYGAAQSIIDAIGFYGSNYLIHKAVKESPNVDLEHLVVFLVSDLAVRNTQFINNFFVSYGGYASGYFSSDMGRNNIIAMVNWIAATIVDLIKKQGFKTALVNNLIRSVIGLASNTAIDKLMPSDYAGYK